MDESRRGKYDKKYVNNFDVGSGVFSTFFWGEGGVQP